MGPVQSCVACFGAHESAGLLLRKPKLNCNTPETVLLTINPYDILQIRSLLMVSARGPSRKAHVGYSIV